MYTSFFGLNEKPFSITPDPRYLFLSERHGEALAHLVYGVTESGGFIQLTGEVGTGKTTLVRSLLLNKMPENADVAVVLNPQLSVIEFLATICEELHIEVPHNKGSVKALTDALNRHLLSAHAEGRRTILVVDEAQNLTPAVLEQVRLLTNLETAKQKLLQIILIGQEELRDLLARNDLRQLAQRITARYHLKPLSRDETSSYIEHRLKVAGALGEVFDAGAKREIYRLSQGVPRVINVICDRALLGAYAQESRRVNPRLIRQAAAEVHGESERSPWVRRAAIAAGIIGVAVIAASILSVTQRESQVQPISVAQEPVAIEVVSQQEPEPEPGPGPGPTLDEQLQMASELTGTDYALAALFETWGLEYHTGGRDSCALAGDSGLTCLYHRGSWAGLRQMDRPAILTLVDSDGNNHDVVLTGITGDNAELSLGGVRVTHAVTDITDVWFGEFMLLWRPPTRTAVWLGPGSQGDDVAWLRNSLAAIDGRYASADSQSQVFDEELEQLVMQFQRDHRLEVDGLAGQQTQIIINSLLAVVGTPRLSTPRLAQD
jgi:general secretion pathway protein A